MKGPGPERRRTLSETKQIDPPQLGGEIRTEDVPHPVVVDKEECALRSFRDPGEPRQEEPLMKPAPKLYSAWSKHLRRIDMSEKSVI